MGMTLPRKGAKRSKYKNKAVYRDATGKVCGKDTPGARKAADSQKEYRRRCVLEMMERDGLITGLRFQARYKLVSKSGHAIETYVADFVYGVPDKVVVEDVKGAITATYRRKRKWMKSEYGITILET